MSARLVDDDNPTLDLPDPALALALSLGASTGLLFIDAAGVRLDRLARMAAAFSPGLEVLTLPAWDSLPYDRTPASAAVIGQRVRALARLAEAPGVARLVLTSARAVMQRVPAPGHWAEAAVRLAPGEAVDAEALRLRLAAFGYHVDEHVDRPGDVAMRGPVIDIYPGDGAHPVRIAVTDGRVVAVHRVDPVSQRSVEDMAGVVLRPVVEAEPAPEQVAAEAARIAHPDGQEADMEAVPVDPGQLTASLFDYVAGMAVLVHPDTPERITEIEEEVADAFQAARSANRAVALPKPGALYLPGAALRRRLAAVAAVRLPAVAADVADPAGELGGPSSDGPILEEPPRLSDVVVHEAHGVCRLSGLRLVGEAERLALAFHDETELLVPTGDLAQIWRYGSAAGQVTLDRLHGEAWHKRRVEIEAAVAVTAKALAAAAKARRTTAAAVIAPPARPFKRVIERFPYPLSLGQEAAIGAVLDDLGAGHPMDRLVCGDVGFGKTEVAIRAAAAVALAGHQVAIVAPTTVLARQHFETFRRRLAGTGLRVEPLLRGADAGPALQGLADGSVDVVIGTQAIAGAKVRFKNLALVVIDEEQRFGDADKRRLTQLREGKGVHTLVMTATPIPRTLQAAIVRLRDISVIATAPVRRQPTRTYVLPFGETIVREALQREHRAGGQSFVVVPRIEDLAPLEERLRSWVPGLSVATAHGRLKPDALEAVVAGFTAGDTDVLLATNIIEAGLDIPRANTILITGPHRFGLAQLHQMRGRVGRGTRRGLAYLLTDPAARLSAPTARRLRTLESLEGLGAGVAIAVADMDARGAGDLFGDQQAGHVQAIGTELYQDILAREVARIEGRAAAPQRPVLHLEIEGRIPETYVPEANLRLELYRRLARLDTAAAVDDFEAELQDRFGPLPAASAVLLDEARLRAWCMGHAVSQVDAGPKAIALTLPGGADGLAAMIPGAVAKEGRVLLPTAARTPAARLLGLLELLAQAGAAAGGEKVAGGG